MLDPVYPGAPAAQTIVCDQGADFALNFTFYHQIPNSDPPQPDLNNPIDLAGSTFECLVRESASKTAKQILAIAVTPTDLPHGAIHLSVPTTTMKTVVPGEYYYDLSATNAGVRRYYLAGPFIVNARSNT